MGEIFYFVVIVFEMSSGFVYVGVECDIYEGRWWLGFDSYRFF